jgi:DNA repair photolyase
MEFLHVQARRVINEVPKASRMPFRWTINAYRGCSHACTYCLDPSTPVLLADGRTEPIGTVEVGDLVYGTVRHGAGRRLVVTPVLDRWTTVKPAYRVTLAGGTELVASGDHRFLTERGWEHVTGSESGGSRRPHLTPGRRLLGPAPPADGAGLRPVVTVEAVEALNVEQPLVDITTGTGDFVANGVISHNCFARPTHEYLGMNTGEDFERRIVVKINAVERVRAELAPARWAGEHIAMGTNTDPYQRCEGKYRLTQGIVGELAAAANPFSILTKSTLILRDLDLLAEAAKRTDVRANFSIGTLDEEVWRLTEPGTPHPLRRVEAVAKLNQAGIPSGVLLAPVLPGLSDDPEQIEAVVKACVDAGARFISPLLLHLRPGVREHYLSWLVEARPDLAEQYAALYPRAYAPAQAQDRLAAMVSGMVERHGGRAARPAETRTDASPRRATRAATPAPARQLELGM